VTDSVEATLHHGLAGHPTADPTLEAVVKRIVEISRRYEHALREVTDLHGISLGDCEVIFELAHSDPADHTPGYLARKFHITAGSVTARLTRLENAGYLERAIQPDNRAQIRITLTAKGHVLHNDAVEDLIALRRHLIADALPAKDLATLNRLLCRILTHIETR
jgi:DNA-binding MarR family transcriptional regulator